MTRRAMMMPTHAMVRLFALLILASALWGCSAHSRPTRVRDESLRPHFDRLAKNPDDVEARLVLAAAMRDLGDLEGALIEIYKALASDPRSAQAHAERARVYFVRDMPEAEISAWRTALEIDPAFLDARENLGHALVAAGKNEEAMAEYRLVLETRDSLPILYNLAILETDAGNATQARLLWTRYVELDPSGPWAERARAALDALAKGGPE